MGEKETRQSQFDQALAEYRVVSQGGNQGSVYIEAEAGTGSRYAVVISRIPFAGAMREGGQHLISVLQPVQSNMVFSVFPGEEIHLDYVREKLIDRVRPGGMSGGDIAGIWKTVNVAARLFDQVAEYARQQEAGSRFREAGL